MTTTEAAGRLLAYVTGLLIPFLPDGDPRWTKIRASLMEYVVAVETSLPSEAATKIADIATTADGGCPNCTADLLLALARAFPDVDWVNALSDPHDRELYGSMLAEQLA